MDTIQSAHNQTIIGDCLASLAGTKLLLVGPPPFHRVRQSDRLSLTQIIGF